jgi:hypothetical protein
VTNLLATLVDVVNGGFTDAIALSYFLTRELIALDEIYDFESKIELGISIKYQF